MLFVWLFLYGAVMLLATMATPWFTYAETAALAGYTLALVIWIVTSGRRKASGFGQVASGGWKKHLFFVPYLLPVFYNLFRFGFSVPAWTDILLILSAAALEEIVFRGFLVRKIRPQGLGILLSTIAFALAHLVNLENGSQLLPVICQVLFALAVGFALSGLSLSCGSVFPCIAIHFFINITAGSGIAVYKDPLFWVCAAGCIGCGIYSTYKNHASKQDVP